MEARGYYHVHKSLLLDPVLNQVDTVHILTSYFSNKGAQFIVTLWFGSGFAAWRLTLLWLPGQNIRRQHSTVSL
jgi:hypothetical protein